MQYDTLLYYMYPRSLPVIHGMREKMWHFGQAILPRSFYGQFSKFHVCFCGLDPGNLKFEKVQTNKQHVCFRDLRRSI